MTTNTTTHHCAECGDCVDREVTGPDDHLYCPAHPGAMVESIRAHESRSDLHITLPIFARWLTPRKAQGQIVEVAYAALGDGRVLERRHDRSDRTTTYWVADLDPHDDDPVGLNRAPTIVGEWVRCWVTP